MIGAIAGDIIGSVYEQFPIKSKDFPLFDSRCRFTDDSVLTVAVADAILRGRPYMSSMREFGRRYPHAGYGGSFIQWLHSPDPRPYNSWGNGAAMRVAPVGVYYHNASDLYAKAALSAEVTHAHPVGIDGAAVQARSVAHVVTLDPREAFPASEFLQDLLDFSRTPEIEAKMRLVKDLFTNNILPGVAAEKIGRSVAVHESMPFAIYAFLRHPTSFEGCLLCAVLNGGDRDTLGAMAGAVSGAYLGIQSIPESWMGKLENRDYIEMLALKLAAGMVTQ